ncbi:hypothetical protein [Nodularia sp. NIES-3585]|uniref:hypothetical protein n=1 Tax=Nodularia sp. NIES-3585 TaxID=1973477 RepID=UPI001595D08B|nr:hypothetical protein [Nodularia sp. NIES-3585]
MPAPQENTINSTLRANHSVGNLLASRPPIRFPTAANLRYSTDKFTGLQSLKRSLTSLTTLSRTLR